MPDTPEGIALALLSMILQRDGPSEVELLALYARCLEAVTGRWRDELDEPEKIEIRH